ncbi:unnamed protein product [Polarella glacialis]|uniref:Uncharacterized protein n=1 Tax=Polarella glacialis TaxID=89957 RepID=A0A813FU57_POLGL|nr:unnamed protein product [Polarella glacialis]
MMQYLPGLQRPKSAPNNASMAGLDDGLSQGHRQASNGVLMLARLPLAKLLLLGVRQAARPVSKVATAAAARSEIFQDCCAGAARMMKSDRLNMPQEQAVQAGCVMVGETVVFGVTGGVLTWEYHKSKEAERQKEHMAREAIATCNTYCSPYVCILFALGTARTRREDDECLENLLSHKSPLAVNTTVAIAA